MQFFSLRTGRLPPRPGLTVRDIIEVSVRGVQAGAVYALIAMGIALIFSVNKVLNFAHGHMFMVSTVVVWWAWQQRAVPLAVTLLIALGLVGLVAVVEERLVIRPTSRYGSIGWVLSTLGFGTIVAWMAERVLDHQPQPISFYVSSQTFDLFGARINTYLTMVAGVSILVAVALIAFLRRTFTGRAIMAVAQNRDAASLRGIDDSRILTLSFALGSMIAGLAGFLMAPFTFAEAHVGLPYVLKGFIAAVLGGVSGKRMIEGALIGGVVLGLFEEWASEITNFDYRDTSVIVLLLVVMLLRPQGLFGIKERMV